MKRYKILAVTLLLAIMSAWAQSPVQLKGVVLDPYGNPIEGAIVSVSGLESEINTDRDGQFTVELKALKGSVNVWFPGYYTNVRAIAGKSDLKIYMIEENKTGYAENMLLPFKGMTNIREKQSSLSAVQKSGIGLNQNDIEQSLLNVPGLQIIEKSGMPGEGSYFSIRGNNTITAGTSPLIVINGVPYMPDMSESGIIGGFSKDIFNVINSRDIQNVTILKGADAAVYGSLGSNGVIMIETDKAVDLDTKVELSTQFGMDMNQSTLPVMGVKDYKSYIGNVALTKYEDMADVLTKFSYLVDDPDYYYNYLYNNNTDWQSLIYSPGFTTDNVLKIKGGDAIAKYDLSIGYKSKDGQISGTNYSKYYTRINSDVNLSRKISLFSSISMAYMKYKVQEQGMLDGTNPVLASLKKGPIFAAYEKDADNNLLPDYASIRDADGNLYENNEVSNPKAIVDLMNGDDHAYDIQINGGLKYKPNEYWDVTGIFGLNYYLSRQKLFIPGVTNTSFMPNLYGVAENTVRDAEGTTYNRYFSLNGNYNRTFNDIHAISASLGGQVLMDYNEYDAGTGYNTANDFYKTLGNVTSSGRIYFGYNNAWNWMNFNANAKYTYNNQFAAGVTMTVDASSSTGPDAALFQFYPALDLAWMTKNSVLKNADFINKLNIRAEMVNTGNSRFSSSLGKYYYVNKVFRDLSGLTRAGIPNTEIVPERNTTFDLGLDASLFNNRLDLTFDAYTTKNTNLIMPVEISAAYGVNYLYQNAGSSRNTGVEFGMQCAVFKTKDFKWYVGGTISADKSEIFSLGDQDQLILTMNDGSAIISEVGKSVSSFYGYESLGVFSTTEEAEDAALTNVAGEAFEAGDIHFKDVDDNHIIDDRDRVNLGSAAPDFYGSFNTSVQYKAFTLSAQFTYSVGNQMYNAVRRSMESMSDFTNQLVSVNRRWMTEGQITDIPRATYDDPMGNSRFSNRWIEDAAYMKLKQLMLSYDFKFMSGSTVYVAGDNLFTVTDYLGLDPETMYSYDASLRGFDYAKTALPRSFKLGLKVQF
ncbi:MAG: SusC/RagA family TonB-linked outer membrane protein [Paludibacter sp.]|nr:SusC/RagA family TonB-linked outer membrane protein [Paludibacter sp.]